MPFKNLLDLLRQAQGWAKGSLLIGSGGATPALQTAGADGTVLTADSTQPNGVRWGAGAPKGAIGITIDGGGATPSTGSRGYVSVPYAGTLTGWIMLADVTGSAQITVKRCAAAAFPSTSSIVASAPCVLGGAQIATSGALSGWATSIAAGDILEFNLDSASGVTRLTLELQITRN